MKMGRPPLPKGEVKTVFTMRVSDAEMDAIRAAAERAGRPVRQWAREMLLEAAGLGSGGSTTLAPRR